MYWTHQVSEAWLRARKNVLTASDIKALLPEWKRVKKKPPKAGEILPMFAGVWCEKHTLTKPDTSSTSSAARGHIFEPYAVASYNEYLEGKEFKRPRRYYHWDDAIIVHNGLGFSPDACSVRQMFDAVELHVNKSKDELVYMLDGKAKIQPAPQRIMEVKSYLPDHHMKSIIKSKMDHDELIQLAVAFAVLPKLEAAELFFFCPDSPYPGVSFEYTRKDLQDLIETCEDMANMYASQSHLLEELDFPMIAPVCSEESIWRMEIEEERSKL